MTPLLHYILLGLLQGFTEFLPISSSGHLVAAQSFLSLQEPGILLEVSLHFGTLLAILIVFRRDLWEIARDTVRGIAMLCAGRSLADIADSAELFSTGMAIVLGTIPAGLAGVLLHDAISNLFGGGLVITGVFLTTTGVILLISQFAPKGNIDLVGPVRGLLIGVAQAFALLPGISRSGSTIVSGYYLGIDRSTAARFSFFLAVPALAGAMCLEGIRLLANRGDLPPIRPACLIAGTGTATLMGWLCLILLLRIVKRGKLHWFAAYCLPAGLGLLAYALI